MLKTCNKIQKICKILQKSKAHTVKNGFNTTTRYHLKSLKKLIDFILKNGPDIRNHHFDVHLKTQYFEFNSKCRMFKMSNFQNKETCALARRIVA